MLARDGEKLEPASLSGYVNTSATAGSTRDPQAVAYGQGASAQFDSVVNAKGFVLEASGLAQDGAPFQRDDVRVTKEIDAKSGLKLSAGDLFYPVIGYQSFTKMGGASAYTATAERRGALGGRTGDKQIEVRQPSTLTFFVNDRPVATKKVLPGLYDLTDLPLATGINRVRVLIEADGTGQRQEVRFEDFLSDYGIRAGQGDFAIAAGLVSTDSPGRRAYDSGNAAILLSHRYDVSNTLSLSQYGQNDAYFGLIGALETLRAPGGYAQVDSAASSYGCRQDLGAATRVSYFKTHPDEFYLLAGDRYSLGLERRLAGFASADTGPQPGQTTGSGAYTFPQWGKLTLGLAASYGAIDSAKGETYSYSGNLSRQVGEAAVTLTAGRSFSLAAPPDYSVAVSVAWAPGSGQRPVSLNSQQSSSSNSTQLSVGSPSEQGARGILAQSSSSQSQATSAQATLTTNRAETTFSESLSQSLADNGIRDAWSANTRFAVAFAGGKAAIGRPVQDSFFITDTKADGRAYGLEASGHKAETSALGEALVGFHGPLGSEARAKVGKGDDMGDAGSFYAERSWKQGYLVKLKQSAAPTVIAISSKDLERLKGMVMAIRNVKTGESASLFISSSGEAYVEGVEVGDYAYELGPYTGAIALTAEGGRLELALD
jgi:hypothetical protein